MRGSGFSILLVCCQHHCSRLFMTLHLMIHVGYFRMFNVNEVMRFLEEEGHFDSAVIHINPPTGEITDEDSGEEESGGNIHKLTGRQLLYDAEVLIRRNERTDEVLPHIPLKLLHIGKVSEPTYGRSYWGGRHDEIQQDWQMSIGGCQ